MEFVMTPESLEAECVRLLFNPPLAQFSIDDVPKALRKFVPYAQIWGHNSEDIRFDIVQETPPSLKRHVYSVIMEPDVQDRFDDWLAGPAVDCWPLSEAYLAFTCLRMSADEMGHTHSFSPENMR